MFDMLSTLHLIHCQNKGLQSCKREYEAENRKNIKSWNNINVYVFDLFVDADVGVQEIESYVFSNFCHTYVNSLWSLKMGN